MMRADSNEFRELLIKGTRLLRKGKAAKAVPLLQQAYESQPDHLDAALNYGGALILTGQFRKAIPVLEALREREPKNAMVWTNLGAAYLGNPVLATDDQQEQAIEAFEKALAIDPRAPSVAYNLGLIHRDREDYQEAIRWLQRALQTNPSDQHARSLLKRLKSQAS